MLQVSEKLRYAYSLKELFYEMMDSADSQTYALRFKRWQEDVLQHNLPQFIRLMNTMIEWKHEIVASIETQDTATASYNWKAATTEPKS